MLVVLLVLALRADHLQMELADCNYFGESKQAVCKRQMDPHRIAQLIAIPWQCAGFHCERRTQYTDEILELHCNGTCRLHYVASNDDEDYDYTYDYAPAGDRVRFSYKQNN